jgi:hypothetical protein
MPSFRFSNPPIFRPQGRAAVLSAGMDIAKSFSATAAQASGGVFVPRN